MVNKISRKKPAKTSLRKRHGLRHDTFLLQIFYPSYWVLGLVGFISCSGEALAQAQPPVGAGAGLSALSGSGVGAFSGNGAFSAAAAGANANETFTITPSIRVSESYTDNVNLDAGNAARADYISTISPSLSIMENSAHVKLGVIYDPQELIYARSNAPDRLEQMLQATGQAEVLPELLFFDTSASIDREFISGQGPFSNSTLTTNSNLQSVSAVTASPYVKLHFGSFANSETRYRFDSITTGGGMVAPIRTNEALERLVSGDEFGRLSWTLLGDYTKTDRLNAPGDPLSNSTQKDVVEEADAQYNLFDALSAIGVIGYERIVDPFSPGLSGPKWNAGLQYKPRESTFISAAYGRHYRQPDVELHAKYELGPELRFHADYTKVAQSALNSVGGNLQALALGPTGALINGTTGLPFVASNAPGGTVSSLFGLYSGITVQTRFEAAAESSRGRNNYLLRAYDEKQTGQGLSTPNQHVIGSSFSWQRELWPTLSANLGADYYRSLFSDGSGRKDHVYSLSVSFDKRISQTISAQLAFYRLDTQSNIAQDTVLSDVVTLSISKQF